jgi:hypothetical protein
MRAFVAVPLAVCAVLASLRPGAPPRQVDAGTALRMELEDLVREADLVVEGRVLADQARRDVRGLVSTTYTLSVRRTFWGTPLGTRRITLPGGVLPDGTGTLLPGMPTLQLGEDVLLFLSAAGSSGARMPVGLAQGKFRVVHDRGAPALERTHDGLVLVDRSTGAVAAPPGACTLDYAEIAARIEAAAADKARTGARGR